MAASSLQHYLTTALSQRGPAALPYAIDVHGAIYQHLASLSYAFPAFRVAVSTFVHNDGRAATLLCAEGPLPLPAPSSTSSSSATPAPSHAPITIWLLEAYPRMPPVVLLSFPTGAAVKPHHPLVDPSGSVSIPYLRSWFFPYYNLIDLVRSLAHLFGQDPPLQKRVIVPPQRSRKYDARTELINQIAKKVQRDITETGESYEREMEGLLATQAKLKKRKEEIAEWKKKLEEEKEMLEQKLQIVCINCDVTRNWVAQTQSKDRLVNRLTAATCIDALEPPSAQMRQVTECAAMEMAIEDTVYALDEALRAGCVPLSAYLKSVRTLAREQFFHHAMVAKLGSA